MGIDTYAATYLPFCFKNILENLEGPTARDLLLSLVIIFTGTAIISKTASFLQDFLFFPVINVTIREFHYRIAEHIHDISYKDYTDLSIPEIVSVQKRVGMCVRFFLRALLMSILPTLFKFCVAFAVIWQLNVFRIGLSLGICFVFIFFYMAISWYLVLRDRAWAVSDKVSFAIGDSLLNTKLVRFYQTFEMKRLRHLVNHEAKAWFNMTLRMDMVQVFLGILIGGMMSALIGLSAYKVQEGSMTIGQFVLLNGQLTALFVPIRQTLMDLRQVFEASVDFGKIIDILSIPLEKKYVVSNSQDSNRKEDISSKNTISRKKEINCDLSRTSGINKKNMLHETHFNFQSENCITLSKVNFSYASDRALFRELSFSIKSHKKTLIYGVSGAGKSTLFGLLTGLLSPQNGTVRVFDEDISNMTLEDLGKVMHYVPQDCQLFNGTFLENLTFGIVDSDLYAIDEALKATKLFDFAKNLPKGLLTPIGEMGAKMSGGERQRLALARALLHKPKILIFDEATNAMDKNTEKHVFDHLIKNIPTIIFVAHRGYVHSKLDEVYKLQNGVIEKMR